MLPQEKDKKRLNRFRLWVSLGAVAFMTVVPLETPFAASAKQKGFASAEEAVKAAIAAAKNNDDNEMLAIFGADAKDLISSGDAVADKTRRGRFLKAYHEKNQLVEEGKKMVLVIGQQNWPFPIPVVKRGNGWVFDTEQGREEILNRRIGRNELSTIQIMLAVVDAQREYTMKDVDGDGLLEYAQTFRSDPGKKNGLYWETKPGEALSPLGPIVAQARSEGYTRGTGTKSGDTSSPYHGYYFRLLKAQGRNAPGGAYDYVVKGNMIGGFALVAHPAEYGNSGVMSFIVNHDGVVYQKDLGENTEKSAQRISRFDPDKRWTKVKE
ncbi:MAG: DUF2950 domain-containing protein [Deltaproteobacteria bacterium]|nr:DUF2950 domain-containing protein [Deltaproteobacteria bacterium]